MLKFTVLVRLGSINVIKNILTYLILGDSVNQKTYPAQTLAAAVLSKVIVKGGEKENLQFALAWDQPIVKFNSKSGIAYHRYFLHQLQTYSLKIF